MTEIIYRRLFSPCVKDEDSRDYIFYEEFNECLGFSIRGEVRYIELIDLESFLDRMKNTKVIGDLK